MSHRGGRQELEQKREREREKEGMAVIFMLSWSTGDVRHMRYGMQAPITNSSGNLMCAEYEINGSCVDIQISYVSSSLIINISSTTIFFRQKLMYRFFLTKREGFLYQ